MLGGGGVMLSSAFRHYAEVSTRTRTLLSDGVSEVWISQGFFWVYKRTRRSRGIRQWQERWSENTYDIYFLDPLPVNLLRLGDTRIIIDGQTYRPTDQQEDPNPGFEAYASIQVRLSLEEVS